MSVEKIRKKLKDCPRSCTGKLWFEWGNSYGVQYRCDTCNHIQILPTNAQLARGISK